MINLTQILIDYRKFIYIKSNIWLSGHYKNLFVLTPIDSEFGTINKIDLSI